MKISNFTSINKSSNPKYLVVMLHGYGTNGNDIIGIAHEAYSHILDQTVFIAPDAPMQCAAPYSEPDTLQWFELYAEDSKMLSTMNQAIISLNNFIDAQLQTFNIPAQNLLFFGFSQGAMMAIQTSLRREVPCNSAICVAGALLFPAELAANIRSKPQFCLIHGEEDNIIPSDSIHNTSRYFDRYQIPHAVHTIPELGHYIDHRTIRIMDQHIKDSCCVKKIT